MKKLLLSVSPCRISFASWYQLELAVSLDFDYSINFGAKADWNYNMNSCVMWYCSFI